jgi:para-aminobenzoate synthetase component 2
MILVIDNYDSFTYNLVQYLWELGADVEVRRNDAVSIEEVESARYSAILISPGPGRPPDAGISCEVIRRLGGKVPILGVCLGHQSLGEVFGAKIVRAPVLMHGKASPIRHDGRTIFSNIPSPFQATRYHSLMVDPATVPPQLEISATTDGELIMGLRASVPGGAPLEGVQFHPESILTIEGKKLMANFLRMVHAFRDAA